MAFYVLPTTKSLGRDESKDDAHHLVFRSTNSTTYTSDLIWSMNTTTVVRSSKHARVVVVCRQIRTRFMFGAARVSSFGRYQIPVEYSTIILCTVQQKVPFFRRAVPQSSPP